MTYKQIQDDALERLDHDHVTASTTNRTRIKRFINEWYRRALVAAGISRLLRHSTTTISVVAGTAEYTLTSTAKVKRISDPDNDVLLREVPIDAIRAIDPDDTSSGNPDSYAVRKVGASTVIVKLFPVPSANATFDVDIEALVTDLSADGDVPVIPEDFHYLLSLGARIAEYELKDDSRYENARMEMEAGLRALRSYINSSPDEVIKPGRLSTDIRISRLGSWYPAGS